MLGHNETVLHDNDHAAVQGGINGGKMVNKWTVQDVTNWLNSVGFQDCTQVFQAHSISGSVVPRLNPDLLREMGIQSVGRRMELQAQIVSVQAKARAQWRNEVLWAETQYRPGPCNNSLPYGFPYCCECVTGRPDIYKITNSKLNILRMQRNNPLCPCCGFQMASDNTDLTEVRDCDVVASTAMIGEPPGTVAVITNSSGVINLTLKSSQCQKACAIITNAKEECLIQEGLMKFGRQ